MSTIDPPSPPLTRTPTSTPGSEAQGASLSATSGAALSLTDFLDVRTLQQIQDSFTAVTQLVTSIRDAQGKRLTAPTDNEARALEERVLDQLILDADASAAGAFVAPIIVEGQKLGSISIDHDAVAIRPAEDAARLLELARTLGVDEVQAQTLVAEVQRTCGANRAAGIQFLYLLANTIARLCFQEHQMRQRLGELSALYRISTVLAAHQDLQQVLDTAARSAAQVMNVKAASIRLLDEAGKELLTRAVFNLSSAYLSKGPVLLERSQIDAAALAGQIVYVEDMASDPRTLYPEDARREGLVSILSVGMIYQGRPIGVVRLYTGRVRRFTKDEEELIRAITQLLASAIQNAIGEQQRLENLRVQRQLRLAADVQTRMLPSAPPNVPPFDIAARYVPSFELGGDFYDFIELEGNLGIAVGDVVGKGVAASLLMASVRASLRAFAQDVYDIDEIIARVNLALCRDTLDREFATVFYGVLDPGTLRLTYCSAGHEPALLLRKGEFTRLDVGGMIVGIDEEQQYSKGLIDLKKGDLLLMYTDGLIDALNFEGQRFGRDRVRKAMLETQGQPARDVLNHILWEMRRFVGLNSSTDDTTIVVVKVT